jgi:hypothetical protein
VGEQLATAAVRSMLRRPAQLATIQRQAAALDDDVGDEVTA